MPIVSNVGLAKLRSGSLQLYKANTGNGLDRGATRRIERLPGLKKGR